MALAAKRGVAIPNLCVAERWRVRRRLELGVDPFAPQHQLDNLIAIVDNQKIQSFGLVKDVLDLDPLADKFRAFRWAVREVDGHNMRELVEVLGSLPQEIDRPTVIIAHTVKGKGVSFMEKRLAWHYKSPTDEQVELALKELGATL